MLTAGVWYLVSLSMVEAILASRHLGHSTITVVNALCTTVRDYCCQK